MPNYSLGIDIGGTFTDIVIHDHDAGRQWSKKVLTTHDDPARAVGAGVGGLLEAARIDPGRVTRVVHATTLFTNALIERTGARTGLITTAGFADTLEIGRERKFELYDLSIAKPEPLIPRDLRLEVHERTVADGGVRQPLDPVELAVRIRRLARPVSRRSPSCSCTPTPIPATRSRPSGSSPCTIPEIATTASHEVAAGDPRVRARLHDGRQRLHQAARPEVSRGDGRTAHRRSVSPRRSCSCSRAAGSPTSPRPSARPSRCSSRARPRAPSRPPSSARRTAAAISSPSTWAARRRSSRSWTAASP